MWQSGEVTLATTQDLHDFPKGLWEWAGHKSGGVRKLFHSSSGRPAGLVIQTPLLGRLSKWAASLATSPDTTPKVILLIGGPGNGKTEAVEHTIAQIDAAFGLSGDLLEAFSQQYSSQDLANIPRRATVDLAKVSGGKASFKVAIVQDASESKVSHRSAASLLLDDLEEIALKRDGTAYVACVNRGVLDEALITSIDSAKSDAQRLLEAIIQSVGLGADAPECWPLKGFDNVAVWPMDVETLIGQESSGLATPSAAGQVIGIAIDPAKWPTLGVCPAGDRCPFCISRGQLEGQPHQSSLLRLLRWYELATGKRWSFRDIFSLFSFLLAGVPASNGETSNSPCEWAAKLIEFSKRPPGKGEPLRLSVPYLLVAAQYQHALFGHWPTTSVRAFRKDIRDLDLKDDSVLLGLYYFLNGNKARSLPATLEAQLGDVCSVLDPALADPDTDVEVSSRTTIQFRDIDMRFSQSIGEGLRFIRRYKCLTNLELDILQLLEKADKELSTQEAVNKRPAVAARVQTFIRDFSCRLVRRSLGVRSGVVRDAQILADFQKVIDGEEGDITLLHEAVKQVAGLLNDGEHFVVHLNTTFGEPLPPRERSAVLITAKQKVKPLELAAGDRPRAPVRFLGVGAAASIQAIPLTYELFKSVRELRRGMLPASLPRAVVALLDTTRARLSGKIVRDEELLEGAEIHIGAGDDVIVRDLGKFIVRQEGRP